MHFIQALQFVKEFSEIARIFDAACSAAAERRESEGLHECTNMEHEKNRSKSLLPLWQIPELS